LSRYRCTVCNYVYDEDRQGEKFSALPDDYRCPVCGSPKSVFVMLAEKVEEKRRGTTVADVLVEQIAAWGVKYVMGIPGTSILGVVDAIRKNAKLTYIQVRHEQTAAFMASAYGKLTGGIAVCLGVSGPGATNLATGLYDANLDHSPVLALTGMVERQLIGPGSLQEIDQYSFFQPICVFDKILMSVEQTTMLVTLAIKHALVRRGVSHIGIPRDVQTLPHETQILPFEGRMPNMAFSQSDTLVYEAAQAIDQSKRPVIIAGFGAVGQGDRLLALAEKISAPIVSTFRSKGVVDEGNRLYVGSHGSIGSTAAAELVMKSDLLIVIGSSFSDLTMIPEKRTIQIDMDPMMIAKRHPVEIGLVGNSAELIPMLTEYVQEKKDGNYLNEIKRLKKGWIDMLQKEVDPKQKPLRPPYIMKVLNEKIDKNATISLDVGENCWWFGRNFWMSGEQKMVMSGYLGSMGFGFPSAMAAALAYPDRQAVCITGDGGFSMVMGDFLTAVKYRMPVKVFLLNNGQLGMIMQEQRVEGYQNWQTELHNCDFAAYARNCGGFGVKVAEPGELPSAVDEALSSEKPSLVDIDTDPKRF
jgi:thiamine pyrophosphate-dependent acetolactate synthase large subunit-like protein/rubredoxin